MISRRILSFGTYKFVLKSSAQSFCREMHLAPNRTLINGQWIGAVDNKHLAVLNPVNGQNVGDVPDMGAADTQKAIEAASAAFHSPQWGGLTAKERSGLLKVCRFFLWLYTN